jgi:hypothetical protein
MRRTILAAMTLGLTAATVRGADLGGEIRVSADYFAAPAPSEQGWASGKFDWSGRISPRLLFTVAAIVEWDSHGDIGSGSVYDVDDRDLKRSLLRFETLTLRALLGPVNLEIGSQRLAWGRTTAVNPTDNLTPHDWTDPLESIRLSQWAARLGVEKERWNLEVAAVAIFAPSRLPALGGRWWTVQPERVPNPAYPDSGPSTLRLKFRDGTSAFPAATWGNAQTGIRGGFRGSRLEWSLSYLHGFDHAPRLVILPSTPAPDHGTWPIFVNRDFRRAEIWGADGALVTGAWAVRAEAARFDFVEPAEQDFLQVQVETEWSRGSWRMILGYGDATRAESFGSTSAALDRALLPAVFVRVARDAPTEWQASLEGAVSTRNGDSAIKLTASKPLSDGIRLGASLAMTDMTLRGSSPAAPFYVSW